MMQVKYLLLSAILIIAGCAPYQQLKPVPEPANAEKGYLELKKKKKSFELEKDEQYFIEFPAAPEKNFYLVVKVFNKDKLQTFLTDKLVKKKKTGEKITDDTHDAKNLGVYPVTSGSTPYYWIVEQVPEDMNLTMEYRYVPQWRYKFENKHAEFENIYQKNKVDRNSYEGIGSTTNMDQMNLQQEMDKVGGRLRNIRPVYEELIKIKTLFPSSILNSSDKAYMNYLRLKDLLENEISFQTKYISALKFFISEKAARGNPAKTLTQVNDFIEYFSLADPPAENVMRESGKIMEKLLGELRVYYEQRLSGKEDAEPFDTELYQIPQFKRLDTLYTAAKITRPAEFVSQWKFVNDFHDKSIAALSAKNKLRSIADSIKSSPQQPANGYIGGYVPAIEAVSKNVPAPFDASHGSYKDFKSAAALNKVTAELAAEVNKTLSGYKEAENVVSQVNALKTQQDYSGMLGILKQHKHLDFLVDKYKDLDQMSVKEQARKIGEALHNYSWWRAEQGMFTLQKDDNFLEPDKIAPLKKEVLSDLEDSLYIKVDQVTRFKVSKFCEESINALENVDSLYEDSVFLPAYDIKYSSGAKGGLIQRKEALVEHLAKLKENEFPAKAIDLLYKEFMNNPSNKGVLKARAVVAHGKHYKGDDKQLKRKMAELDPWLAKWVVEAAKYRRLFALPITTKKNSPNTYLFRVNVRIPTDAKFPVYDVNMKLPEYIAKNAGTEKWYEKMLLNKKELKNEGRFTITAPTAANDNECQISPVRMEKDESNFLEVYFQYPGLIPIPVSVMAQKPIIKKN